MPQTQYRRALLASLMVAVSATTTPHAHAVGALSYSYLGALGPSRIDVHTPTAICDGPAPGTTQAVALTITLPSSPVPAADFEFASIAHLPHELRLPEGFTVTSITHGETLRTQAARDGGGIDTSSLLSGWVARTIPHQLHDAEPHIRAAFYSPDIGRALYGEAFVRHVHSGAMSTMYGEQPISDEAVAELRRAAGLGDDVPIRPVARTALMWHALNVDAFSSGHSDDHTLGMFENRVVPRDLEDIANDNLVGDNMNRAWIYETPHTADTLLGVFDDESPIRFPTHDLNHTYLKDVVPETQIQRGQLTNQELTYMWTFLGDHLRSIGKYSHAEPPVFDEYRAIVDRAGLDPDWTLDISTEPDPRLGIYTSYQRTVVQRELLLNPGGWTEYFRDLSFEQLPVATAYVDGTTVIFDGGVGTTKITVRGTMPVTAPSKVSVVGQPLVIATEFDDPEGPAAITMAPMVRPSGADTTGARAALAQLEQQGTPVKWLPDRTTLQETPIPTKAIDDPLGYGGTDAVESNTQLWPALADNNPYGWAPYSLQGDLVERTRLNLSDAEDLVTIPALGADPTTLCAPPVDEPGVTPPVDEPDTTPPVDEPSVTPSVDEPPATTQVEEPHAMAPVNEPDSAPQSEPRARLATTGAATLGVGVLALTLAGVSVLSTRRRHRKH